jgi:Senescence regulator
MTKTSTPSRKAFNQSAPMAVPVWPGRRREGRKGRREAGEDMWGLEEEGERDRIGEDEMEEIVPPHVIVARSHMTSFSVLEGAGRTLKGRDLRSVRNAVLQKTGFLDV